MMDRISPIEVAIRYARLLPRCECCGFNPPAVEASHKVRGMVKMCQPCFNIELNEGKLMALPLETK